MELSLEEEPEAPVVTARSFSARPSSAVPLETPAVPPVRAVTPPGVKQLLPAIEKPAAKPARQELVAAPAPGRTCGEGMGGR